MVALRAETDEVVEKLKAINDKRNATIAELTAKLAVLTARFHSLRIDEAIAAA